MAPEQRDIGLKQRFATEMNQADVRKRRAIVLIIVSAKNSQQLDHLRRMPMAELGEFLADNLSHLTEDEALAILANAFVTPMGPFDSVVVYNAVAPAHAIIDVFGWIGQ